MKVSAKNMERFAQFEFEGHNLSIMNGYFDSQNPELTIHKGQYFEKFDNLAAIAESKNTNKFVLNFWVKDLGGNTIEITGEYTPKEGEFN